MDAYNNKSPLILEGFSVKLLTQSSEKLLLLFPFLDLGVALGARGGAGLLFLFP